MFPNGTGYDLHKIDNSVGYIEAITNQNLTFFFHACGDTKNLPDTSKDVNNTCKDGYSVCMYNSTSVNTTTSTNASVLGTFSDMNFDFKERQLKFKNAVIQLECTPDGKASILYAPLESVDTNMVVSNFEI